MSGVASFGGFGSSEAPAGGRRRTRRSGGLKTKTLRRMCKQRGMKTTGKKATLMKRLHLKGGATKGDDGKWTITGSDTKYDTEEQTKLENTLDYLNSVLSSSTEEYIKKLLIEDIKNIKEYLYSKQ